MHDRRRRHRHRARGPGVAGGGHPGGGTPDVQDGAALVYACHSPIEMVEKRRLHFSMIYGTSAADGVFVLGEVEKNALSDHEWKVKDRRARGRLSMLDEEEHSPGPYGAMRSRHLEDLPALVTDLARRTKDAPRTFERFAATVMEKHFVSPTEIKKKSLSWRNRGSSSQLGRRATRTPAFRTAAT